MDNNGKLKKNDNLPSSYLTEVSSLFRNLGISVKNDFFIPFSSGFFIIGTEIEQFKP